MTTLSGRGNNMKISAEILIEDRSGAIIAASLIDQEFKILENDLGGKKDFKYELHYRPHRGVGKIPLNWEEPLRASASSLLELLPAKCRAYSRSLDYKRDIIIVCFDSDFHEPEELYNGVNKVFSYYLNEFQCIIGIAQEELEAWLLGDKEAIEEAYPNCDRNVLDAYVQDSVCGTWETLCRAIEGEKAEDIIESDYKITGRYKSEWAEHISLHLDCRRNVSPSYTKFRQELTQAVNRLKNKS